MFTGGFKTEKPQVMWFRWLVGVAEGEALGRSQEGSRRPQQAPRLGEAKGREPVELGDPRRGPRGDDERARGLMTGQEWAAGKAGTGTEGVG